MDHPPRRVAVVGIQRHDRCLVRADDVLVAHHRLLHLVGHVTPPAAAHAVREPRKACRVENTVVVVLQREIPVFHERHVEAGVDTAKPGNDVLAGLRALRPVVTSVAQSVAAHADHAGPVGEARNVGADLEVNARQGRVETVLAHHKVLIEGVVL